MERSGRYDITGDGQMEGKIHEKNLKLKRAERISQEVSHFSTGTPLSFLPSFPKSGEFGRELQSFVSCLMRSSGVDWLPLLSGCLRRLWLVSDGLYRGNWGI